MALIRYGSLVSEIRGSINGATFFRTRSGATVRNRIAPINPNTQLQADIRWAFSQVAKRYATLNSQEKDQWDEYARLISPPTNRLGEKYSPSGRQVFQYCNMNLLMASAQLVNSGTLASHQFDFSRIISSPIFDLTEKPAPPQPVQGGDKLFAANLTGGQLNFFQSVSQFAPPNVNDDEQVIVVHATPFTRPTNRNTTNRYRLLQAFPLTTASILNLAPSHITLFAQTGLAEGMTANVRMYTVNKAGLRSDYIEQRVEIA